MPRPTLTPTVVLVGAAALLAGCATPSPRLALPAPLAPPVVTAPNLAAPGPPSPSAALRPPPSPSSTCEAAPFAAAANVNARSLTTSPWMFSAGTGEKPEGPGWELYVPAILRTLGTGCSPATAGFAEALAAWQSRQGLTADGTMSRQTAAKLKEGWQARRAHLQRPCIERPRAQTAAIPEEARYEKRDLRLEPDVLRAYLQLLAEAKAARVEISATQGALLAASSWRDPADDKASCTRNPGPCNGTAKAVGCSAHWSGRALDLNLGFLPGRDPTDSTYANRLHQSRSAAYAWLLDNAGRFGFVNYYYEPWHWEWQGVDIAAAADRPSSSPGG